MMTKNTNALFIIFGATGDLASRKLYPALYQLYTKNFLSDNFAVIGTARREWADEYFQNIVKEAVEDGADSEEDAEKFSKHFYYQSHNVKDTAHYTKLKSLADSLDDKYSINGNRVFYLSMSPNLFGVITKHLHTEELITKDGFNRVIIEKPFGFDYDSSKELNDEIAETFTPDQIFRIDHYLGKEMAQNILALRFSNPLFENIWDNSSISNVQITLNENLGVGERGGYYDSSGALKDMAQNHILQIFSLLAMEPPTAFNAEEVSKQKVKALNSLKLVDKANIKDYIVRGQYVPSLTNESSLAYRSEEQVDENSMTETFVAGKLEVDNDRWNGVPFYYRTGKQLSEKVTQVDVVFSGTSQGLFEEEEASANVLTIYLDPRKGVTLTLNQKEIGHEMIIQPRTLADFRNEEEISRTPEAYEKLILDVLKGDSSHFAHYEEVAASWKYVDSIKKAWENSSDDLNFYEIGTDGPEEADQLLEKDGNHWIWHKESDR